MTLENITDVNRFFEVIDSCKGKVEIVSAEGDRLNMKSKLTQFVLATKIFDNPIIKELEIIAEEPEDKVRLIDYMINR